MFGWLKNLWQSLCDRRKESRGIDSRAFKKMAREVNTLASMAGQVGPAEDEFQAKLRRMRAEMDKLDLLAGRPEFRRLSRKQRLLLRESLLQSRNQLLETMRNAPTPTNRLQ